MAINIIMKVLNSVGYEPMYPFNPANCLNAILIDTSTASQYNITISGIETPLTADIGNSMGIISFVPNVTNAANATLSINETKALPIRMADGTNVVAGALTAGRTTFLKYNNNGFSLLMDKASIGLNNVDNTKDIDKPISKLTQEALNNKMNLPVLIPNGSNLNNYRSPGFYYCLKNSDAATMANIPKQQSFSLLVEQNGGTVQTFSAWNSDNSGSGARMWRRVYTNGTWSTWVQIAMVFSGTSDPSQSLGQDGNIYIKYE